MNIFIYNDIMNIYIGIYIYRRYNEYIYIGRYLDISCYPFFIFFSIFKFLRLGIEIGTYLNIPTYHFCYSVEDSFMGVEGCVFMRG